MSGKRVSSSWCGLAALAMAAPFALSATAARAQDCPTAQSGKTGFVAERGATQKSEIFHLGDGRIRTVMRYNGAAVLETTQYEGLFQLDRLDNGKKTRYEPQTDLKSLFPLKPGRTVTAAFNWESNGRRGTLSVELAVKGKDVLYVGPCRYGVLKIDRTESYDGRPPRFIDTDDYSPELRLVLAKEYRGSGGGTQIVKYDRVHSLKP